MKEKSERGLASACHNIVESVECVSCEENIFWSEKPRWWLCHARNRSQDNCQIIVQRGCHHYQQTLLLAIFCLNFRSTVSSPNWSHTIKLKLKTHAPVIYDVFSHQEPVNKTQTVSQHSPFFSCCLQPVVVGVYLTSQPRMELLECNPFPNHVIMLNNNEPVCTYFEGSRQYTAHS